jgi:hypothetical protein
MDTPEPYPSTICILETNFLGDQIRALTQYSPRPSTQWRSTQKMINGYPSLTGTGNVLGRVHESSGLHFRRVYTPQATRAVADRLEASFFDGLCCGSRSNSMTQDTKAGHPFMHASPLRTNINLSMTDQYPDL